MITKRRAFAIITLVLCTGFNLSVAAFAETDAAEICKYPDYAAEYLGEDKYEKFNRKMFNFNTKLNKYAIRPIHTVWASVMPKYGMDRIKGVSTNIEYPKRLVSSLIQKDFKTSGRETVRFLTNSTIGLGGMYDPAKKFLKIEPADETMEQALAKCKCKPGPYIVAPVLSSTTPRGLVGKGLDAALNPSCYIVTPVLALVKAGLLVNRTSYMQPVAKMIESTYADPYEIAKKLYGIQTYIQCANLDRKEVLETEAELLGEPQEEDVNNVVNIKTEKAEASVTKDVILNDNPNESMLFADMVLFDYHPQNPVVDAMRTALFELPEVNDSMWSDLSVWNRCFSKKIKTSSVNIDPERENYKFKYIMQKDKNSPVAVIFPSIGEGITSHHSVILAKMFYDAGYSVIIEGSSFQWEFAKSMPSDFRPGIPSQDADYLKTVTAKIINNLQAKYDCEFKDKLVIGTSYGALTALFLADKEYRNNTLNISKYITINPPIELIYAMKQVDKNNVEWDKNPGDLKNKVAVTAAKIIQIAQNRDENDEKTETLPFSEEEGRLITGFIMHQKLSDLIYTIESDNVADKKELYKNINNMTYEDYARKYLLSSNNITFDELAYNTSLSSISEYLQNAQNYKIYHSLDDYLINREQLKQLKKYSGDKTVILSNGSHLGFLYRPEFLDSLKKDISFKNETTAQKPAELMANMQ